MDERDRAIVAPARPSCGECRDQVILSNLAWLDAKGYTIGREFVVDPDGGGGFAVGLLAEPGLTPATTRALECRPSVERTTANLIRTERVR